MHKYSIMIMMIIHSNYHFYKVMNFLAEPLFPLRGAPGSAIHHLGNTAIWCGMKGHKNDLLLTVTFKVTWTNFTVQYLHWPANSYITEVHIRFIYGARRFFAVFTKVHALTSSFSRNVILPYTNRDRTWFRGNVIPVLVSQTHVSSLQFDNHHRTWLNGRTILHARARAHARTHAHTHTHTPRKEKQPPLYPSMEAHLKVNTE
jgi:hypothetical protein